MGIFSSFSTYRASCSCKSELKKLDKERHEIGDEAYFEKIGDILTKWEGSVSSSHKRLYQSTLKDFHKFHNDQVQEIVSKKGSFTKFSYQTKLNQVITNWRAHIDPTNMSEFREAVDAMNVRYVGIKDPDSGIQEIINIDEKLEGNVEELERIYKAITQVTNNKNSLVEQDSFPKLKQIEQEIFEKLPKNPTTNELHKKFLQRLKDKEKMPEQAEFPPVPSEITKVESLRLKNRGMERERLEAIPYISQLFNDPDLRGHYFDKIAIGHVLELREALKETHYVVTHGQNSTMMCLGMFSRALKMIMDPQFHVSCYPLRHKHNSDQDASFYIQEIKAGNYTDPKYTEEVLCADFVLYNNERYESAYSFYGNMTGNICSSYGFLDEQLRAIAQDYFTDEKIIQQLIEGVNNIFLYSVRHHGNLYAICIPKTEFKDAAFFSKAHGRRPQEEDFDSRCLEYLDSQQNTAFSGRQVTDLPQVRLVTGKINPEAGFHVVVASDETSEKREDYDKQLQDLILSIASSQSAS